MERVVFFSTEKELSQLTGLNHEELWNNGFNLDDWDWGFATWTDWEKIEFEDDDFSFKNRILNSMSNYCVGYEHTEYNGLHYYIQYHS